MTTPSPTQTARYAARLVERARGLLAAPDDMAARRAYMQAAFNHDWTAAAIAQLADGPPAEEDYPLSLLVAVKEALLRVSEDPQLEDARAILDAIHATGGRKLP